MLTKRTMAACTAAGWEKQGQELGMVPARPHCVHVGPVCHLDNELDIAIVVVVGASRHLHTMYCQQTDLPMPAPERIKLSQQGGWATSINMRLLSRCSRHARQEGQAMPLHGHGARQGFICAVSQAAASPAPRRIDRPCGCAPRRCACPRALPWLRAPPRAHCQSACRPTSGCCG